MGRCGSIAASRSSLSSSNLSSSKIDSSVPNIIDCWTPLYPHQLLPRNTLSTSSKTNHITRRKPAHIGIFLSVDWAKPLAAKAGCKYFTYCCKKRDHCFFFFCTQCSNNSDNEKKNISGEWKWKLYMCRDVGVF